MINVLALDAPDFAVALIAKIQFNFHENQRNQAQFKIKGV